MAQKAPEANGARHGRAGMTQVEVGQKELAFVNQC